MRVYNEPEKLTCGRVARFSSGSIVGVCNVLTRRERDILYLLAQGKTNKEIARSLGLPEATVKFQLAALRKARLVRSLAVTTGRARPRRSP
jgi:DNA-binding NarL/FixJ family response regulator